MTTTTPRRPGLPERYYVAPADRPHETRRAIRLLVVDDTGRLGDTQARILLFRDSDPALIPMPHWWITPGGGVDPGERDEQTAVRELAEETGQHIGEGDLVGPLATREVLHGYSDKIVHQSEAYYLVRLAAFAVDRSGHTEEERLTMTSSRWWTRAELAATADDVWPRTLLEIWDHAARVGAVAPLELPDSEESSVPA